MHVAGKKILCEMVLEDKATQLIQTLDGSDRPQTLLGKVLCIGDEVKTIKVGDYVLAQVGVGDCYKDGDGKKYKSMDAHLVSIAFDESEMEFSKQFKRI